MSQIIPEKFTEESLTFITQIQHVLKRKFGQYNSNVPGIEAVREQICSITKRFLNRQFLLEDEKKVSIRFCKFVNERCVSFHIF